MVHKMKLNNRPYQLIKSKMKTIELRLYDEKRKLINIDDIIVFKNISSGEELEVEVLNLHIYKSFKELYEKFDKVKLGYLENELASPNDMNLYYTDDDIKKYGVVGIEIKLKGE